MTSDRKISLAQLYRQRKLKTRMPEELKLALLKAAEQKKRSRQRTAAAFLTAACTIFMTVLVLPDQPHTDIEEASYRESDAMELSTIQTSSPTAAMRSNQEKVNRFSADAAATSELMAAPSLDKDLQNNLILKAVPNRPGLFETCSGEQVTFDIKTEYQGWFEARHSPEGWVVSGEKDCEQAQ